VHHHDGGKRPLAFRQAEVTPELDAGSRETHLNPLRQSRRGSREQHHQQDKDGWFHVEHGDSLLADAEAAKYLTQQRVRSELSRDAGQGLLGQLEIFCK
jgi:hypothetical protein